MDDVINITQRLLLNLDFQSSHKINDANADVTVYAEDGESIRAHKAILVRCPYFSAMLQGGWLENQTSSINIAGYSSATLLFVINHLYEPSEVKFEDNADFVEIFALSDMLGLQQLVEAVITRIVQKLCHNFHKPCPECIPGVISCLQLSSRFNILDLEQRCVSWISKYFVKVWKSRPFASLPKLFHAKCLEAMCSSINISNVMNLLLESQQLKDTLPSVKWTEPISDMIQELRERLFEFLLMNFSSTFKTSWFKNLRDCDDWHIKCVQQHLSDASEILPVEQACRAYIEIDRLMECSSQTNETNGESEQYLQFLANVNQAVEKRLVKQVAMATKCPSWKELPKTKQTAIMQLGFFSPIEKKRSQPKAVHSRTPVRRNGSLNEPKRPEVNERPSASRPSPIERAAEQTNFQRNALRSTAPRLRSVNEARSESSTRAHSNQAPRRKIVANQHPSASPKLERRPWR